MTSTATNGLEVRRGDRVRNIHTMKEFLVIYIQDIDGETVWTLDNGLTVRESRMFNWSKVRS